MSKLRDCNSISFTALKVARNLSSTRAILLFRYSRGWPPCPLILSMFLKLGPRYDESMSGANVYAYAYFFLTLQNLKQQQARREQFSAGDALSRLGPGIIPLPKCANRKSPVENDGNNQSQAQLHIAATISFDTASQACSWLV